MDSLRARMESAAEGFRPGGDWLEGAMERARHRQRRRRIAATAIALVVFAASFALVWTAFRPSERGTPAGAPACARTWSQSLPQQTSGGFTAVSGTSPDDVWAVGPNEDSQPGSQTTIQHWTGEGWERVSSPNGASGSDAVNELNGVVAISPGDAWAVGEYRESPQTSDAYPTRTLVEHWDGSSWSIVSTPNPSSSENRLSAVAAAGPNDVWAVGLAGVGTRSTTLIEHWDGQRWSVVATPDVTTGTEGAELSAISVVSTQDIWAIGSQPSGVLIEHWDGSSWPPRSRWSCSSPLPRHG
jgi:hypothetical protein